MRAELISIKSDLHIKLKLEITLCDFAHITLECSKLTSEKERSSFYAAGSCWSSALFSEPVAFQDTVLLLFMATYQPVIEMFSSVCFRTCVCHSHTPSRSLCGSLVTHCLHSAVCRKNNATNTTESAEIKWYVDAILIVIEGGPVYVLQLYADASKCDVWKSFHGFQQGVDFLGSQTGTFMGDTGESNNTSVKVHINQISLHEVYLNVIFNPNTAAAIY